VILNGYANYMIYLTSS